MKPVISLIEALNAVKNNLASLNEQKESSPAQSERSTVK